MGDDRMWLAILLMIGIVVLISATRTRASDSGGPDSGYVSDGDCDGGDGGGDGGGD